MARDFCVVLAYALRAYGELGAAIPAGYAALLWTLVVPTVMHYFVFNGVFSASPAATRHPLQRERVRVRLRSPLRMLKACKSIARKAYRPHADSPR